MPHTDDARLLDRAARLLFAGMPTALLAGMARAPKATAKSWRQGRRRAPIRVVRQLLPLLQAHAAECNSLHRDIENWIFVREVEPRHRGGFCAIDPLTGLDKRNRRGRPSRTRL